MREDIPLILEFMGLADLIINKDRRTTITTPLGETGISKIITLKTEGFIHKKIDRKALPWIETRCQEEMETDHHLLDPLTDKQTQEEAGVDQTTLIPKTQGFTHKRIGRTPILPRVTLS